MYHSRAIHFTTICPFLQRLLHIIQMPSRSEMRPDRMIKSEEPFLNSEERNETNLFDFVKCDSTPYQFAIQTFQATGTCKMLVAENDSE
ncbi:hypothetical protein GQ55_9G027100 [Panicum hallii var. hallii]|uniref:Uncharacterized protein n=1 Tax=Panicum hallii var. hallii TaxID=1504633 RepID=A0A2T7BZ81_9POAL|nr:hypothetical protein GQ55_9G027100 [Panicum hallii var. hallii]